MVSHQVQLRPGGLGEKRSGNRKVLTLNEHKKLYLSTKGLPRRSLCFFSRKGAGTRLSGRQGDPGESQFFVCLEKVRPDTLFDLEFYKVKRYPRLLRRAQKLQESRDAEARYILERYSRIQEGQRRLVTDYRTKILLDLKEPEILKNRQPSTYRSYEKRYGAHSLKLAEKQLTLYFINANWTDYLAALEDKRSGIHLTIIGGKNPLEEYQLFAASAFHEMWEDIQQDVLGYLKKCEITGSGIDLEAAGLLGATTTWTYVINESANQFSAIPRLRRAVSGQIRGTLFTVRGVYRRMVEMIKSKAGGQKM